MVQDSFGAVPLSILKDNGIRCDCVSPSISFEGPSYLVLRIVTSGLQFLLHLLLRWRFGVSFSLHPFENLRRGQKNGTSGDLSLLGACVTGCKGEEEGSDLFLP